MHHRKDADLKEITGTLCDVMLDSELHHDYCARHGISAQPVLTITDDETGAALADFLAPRIEGKTVVEIGGGVGLLALHMSTVAKRVYCIEANPMWSAVFAWSLMAKKPKNVSFLFGAADEFDQIVKADVALFCTHSGVDTMTAIASRFAPIVIDVYGELIAKNPGIYDAFAREARKFA